MYDNLRTGFKGNFIQYIIFSNTDNWCVPCDCPIEFCQCDANYDHVVADGNVPL
jgi:hypothetical protein